MNNLAFVVPINVCLPLDALNLLGGGRGGGIIPYTCMGWVGKYR